MWDGPTNALNSCSLLISISVSNSKFRDHTVLYKLVTLHAKLRPTVDPFAEELKRLIMEESLLRKSWEDKTSEPPSLTWGAFTDELKRVGSLAGPMVAVNLSQHLLLVISIMMVGHLGERALSSTAIAISLSSVTGFSLLVRVYHNITYLSLLFSTDVIANQTYIGRHEGLLSFWVVVRRHL